jgi:hypothetical protein
LLFSISVGQKTTENVTDAAKPGTKFQVGFFLFGFSFCCVSAFSSSYDKLDEKERHFWLLSPFFLPFFQIARYHQQEKRGKFSVVEAPIVVPQLVVAAVDPEVDLAADREVAVPDAAAVVAKRQLWIVFPRLFAALSLMLSLMSVCCSWLLLDAFFD